MGAAELRVHGTKILAAITADMRRPQTPLQQMAKSKGLVPAVERGSLTAAESYAVLRARSGFYVNQMASEYRALRASVLRLWFATAPAVGPEDTDDLMRFNQAVDQTLTEALGHFTAEAEAPGFCSSASSCTTCATR